MAAPIVVRSAVTESTTASTVFNVNLPAGRQAGNLLIIMLRSADLIPVAPMDWKYAEYYPPHAFFVKVLDGTEANTVPIQLASSGSPAAVAYEISGHAGIENLSFKRANPATPATLPRIKPHWLGEETLWIALRSTQRATLIYTAAPSGYSNFIVSPGVEFELSYHKIAAATRTLTADTEQPGNFTMDGNEDSPQAGGVAVRGLPIVLQVLDVTDGADRVFTDGQGQIATTGRDFGWPAIELDNDWVFTVNTQLEGSLTVNMPFGYVGYPGTIDVMVLWGDGTNTSVSTAGGTASHTYSSHGVYEIRVSGRALWYPTVSNVSNSYSVGLVSISNWGQGLEAITKPGMFQHASATGEHVVALAGKLPPTLRVLSFRGGTSFNVPLSFMGTEGLIELTECFRECLIFNQPLNDWSVGAVEVFNDMFTGAVAFNQPLGNWDVSSARSMNTMFSQAFAFNQPLNSWDVSAVQTFYSTFDSATAFNQDIGMWPLRVAGVSMNGMLNNCGMSPENYARTLIGWSNYVNTNDGPINVALGAVNVEYSPLNYVPAATHKNAMEARTYLTSRGWTITDGGLDLVGYPEYDPDFVMEVDTTLTGQAPAGQIYIRLTMYDAIPPDVYINWGDGTPEDHYTTIGLKYHAYAPPGQYTVRMRGTLHSISSSGFGLPWTTKVISIGNLGWRSMQRMFNLMPVGSSVPEVVIPSTLTEDYFVSCFAEYSYVNTPINWDFKSLGYTNLRRLFYESLGFNQDINHWDVSSVTNFDGCFSWSEVFNQPLNNWNVSNVSNMTQMFRRADAFDQDIGMWPLRIAGVTMTGMFDASGTFGMSPENYARTLIGWSNYVNTNAGPINVPLGAANVKYGDTYVPGGTYFDAQGARDHLTATRGWTITDAGWEQVAAVGQSSELLRTYDTTLGDGNNSITIPIGGTGVKRVYWGDGTFNDYTTETTASRTYAAPGTYLTRTRGTGLSKPFNGSHQATKLVDCHSYGLGLGVTDISGLFFGAASFNQPLNAWDVSNATKAQVLFRAASTFNQPLNAWNVSNVNDMAHMFLIAAAFNQPLDNWDVSQVTSMESMFNGAVAFDQDIGMWPLRIAGVDMRWMLDNCGMSVENYSRTLIGWANYVAANGGPLNVTLGATNKTYNNTAYVTGQTYNDAAAARAYLTTATGSGGAGWTITDGGQV